MTAELSEDLKLEIETAFEQLFLNAMAKALRKLSAMCERQPVAVVLGESEAPCDGSIKEGQVRFASVSDWAERTLGQGPSIQKVVPINQGETFEQAFLRMEEEKKARVVGIAQEEVKADAAAHSPPAFVIAPSGHVVAAPVAADSVVAPAPVAAAEKPKRGRKPKTPKSQPALMPEVVEEIEDEDAPEPAPLVMDALVSEVEIAQMVTGFKNEQLANQAEAAARAMDIALSFKNGAALVLTSKKTGKSFTYALDAAGRGVRENGELIEADQNSGVYWRFIHPLLGDAPKLDDAATYRVEELF